MPEPDSKLNGVDTDLEPDAERGEPDAGGNEPPAGGSKGATNKPPRIHGIETVDPERTIRLNKAGKPDGRTTRWQKGRTAETTAAISQTIDKVSLTELLYSIHAMGAAILAIPEIELDKEEAKKLGDAVKEVGKHYAMVFDPKHVAIANLFAISGFLYGPRIIAYRARRRAERGPQELKKPVPIKPPVQEPPKPEKPDPLIPVAKAPNGSGPQMSPSQLWPEPAAESPGLG